MLLTLYKRKCFFSFVLSIFKNLNDLEPTNHCKRVHFQKSELVFRITLKGKSGINRI